MRQGGMPARTPAWQAGGPLYGGAWANARTAAKIGIAYENHSPNHPVGVPAARRGIGSGAGCFVDLRRRYGRHEQIGGPLHRLLPVRLRRLDRRASAAGRPRPLRPLRRAPGPQRKGGARHPAKPPPRAGRGAAPSIRRSAISTPVAWIRPLSRKRAYRLSSRNWSASAPSAMATTSPPKSCACTAWEWACCSASARGRTPRTRTA